MKHQHLLAFQMCSATICAGGETLLGGHPARYTPNAGGAVSAMPAAGSPSPVLNLRHHRSVARRQKRPAGSHD